MSNTSSKNRAFVVDSLSRNGWVICPSYLNRDEGQTLSDESQHAWDAGEFRRAGVGRGDDLQVRHEVRRDHVMWLRTGETTESQQAYLVELEMLRLAINQQLFLGLFDFEGHFAFYPEGGFYKAHLDRHRETGGRIVSVILYLNADWESGDGGELKLWTKAADREGAFELVEPRLGTLVCFMAGDHWHEVLPTTKTRRSITGWFQIRS